MPKVVNYLKPKTQKKYKDATRYPKVVLPIEREFNTNYGTILSTLIDTLTIKIKEYE